MQNITEDKYLNLYRIDSNLVDYNKNTLESRINYTHIDEDIFLGFNASVFETLEAKGRINTNMFYQKLLFKGTYCLMKNLGI